MSSSSSFPLATEKGAPPVPLESLHRVASYPVVSSVFQYVTAFYSGAKNSESALLRSAVSTAEHIVVSPLSRVSERYPDAVKQIDSLALHQLDSVETLVSHGAQYAQSTKDYASNIVQLGVQYRHRCQERIATAIATPTQLVASFSNRTQPQPAGNAATSEQKEREQKASPAAQVPSFSSLVEERLFRPVFHMITPYVDYVNTKKTVLVRAVNDGVEGRKRFAEGMFKQARETVKSSSQHAAAAAASRLESARDTTTQTVRAALQNPSGLQYYQRVKQSTVVQLASASVPVGISYSRGLLKQLRAAIVYLEQTGSTPTTTTTNTTISDASVLLQRSLALVPPALFHAASSSVDVSDRLLENVAGYFVAEQKQSSEAGQVNEKEEVVVGEVSALPEIHEEVIKVVHHHAQADDQRESESQQEEDDVEEDEDEMSSSSSSSGSEDEQEEEN